MARNSSSSRFIPAKVYSCQTRMIISQGHCGSAHNLGKNDGEHDVNMRHGQLYYEINKPAWSITECHYSIYP